MSRNTTINQIVEAFREFADNHKQLQDFDYGDTSDIGTSRDMKFPYLWLTHQSASSIAINQRNQVPVVTMTFICVDQNNDQENYRDANGYSSNNIQDVSSDTYQILQDVINYVQSHLRKNGLSIPEGTTANVNFVQDETTDKAYGWQMDLDLQVMYQNCAIPGIDE